MRHRQRRHHNIFIRIQFRYSEGRIEFGGSIHPVYIGKLVWGGIVYEGNHQPIISQPLFNRARKTLQRRREDLKGRQWRNKDARLLTGLVKCAPCKSPMFGGGAKKNGTYIPYYMCSKRSRTHDCDQDYIRADRIEATIIDDIKTIFRDQVFLNRVWEETNRRLASKGPDVEEQIKTVESECAKVQARLDRYFDAFETGAMKPEPCGQKVEELAGRLDQLEAQRVTLEQRRKQLKIPAINHDMIEALIDNFEDVLAAGTNPQKKHLIGLLVKKVLVHHREKIEVWYQLPNTQRFEHWDNWLPGQEIARTFVEALLAA